MKPVDMKVTAKAARGAMVVNVAGNPAGKGKVYPWGLEIRLDSASLDKLGWKDMPEVGEECVIHAMAEVTEVRQAAHGDGKTRHVVLQITKMSATCEEEPGESMEKGFARGPKRSKGY